jgi:HEAT repeat protein
VFRLLPIAGFAIVSLGLSGCAADWETLTGHRFRDGMLEHPYQTMLTLWVVEEPMLVLRTDPPRDPDERIAAMRRLKEPIYNHATQEDQDIIVNILSKAAISDNSPVLRIEAIEALGRFKDPRVAGILMAAYQSAHGQKPYDTAPPRPESVVLTAGMSAGRAPTASGNKQQSFDWTKSPSGFQTEWVTAIRCRILDSLGRTNREEAARFLAAIAGGAGVDIAPEGSEDRDIRLGAVRGLGQCRNPIAVQSLVQVLSQAKSVSPNLQDTAIIGRTNEGLVRLTGKNLPPEPGQWNEVVQAGIVVVPEPGWWQNTIMQVSAWTK